MQRIRGINQRRDYDGVLTEHERQAPELRDAVNVARGHLLAADNLESQEYQLPRLRKELDALMSTTVPTLAEAIRAAEDRVPEPAPPPKAATDHGAQFDRLLHRLGIEPTPAGVSALLRESEQAGLLERVWPYAASRLRAFAATEQRQHTLPSPNSAFTAWSMWSARMGRGAAGEASVTRAQQQRAIRVRGLAIADVIGLRAQVEQRLRASVPEPSTTAGGGLIFGRHFEQ